MSLRQIFFDELYSWMQVNKNIVCVTADLGFRYWGNIANDFPNRFCTTGAAEQLAVGVGVGLALEGKIPVIYSITPFLLYRPAEWLRNYLNHEQIPVKLVGSGYLNDYAHDGYTHYCDADLMQCYPNIKTFIPTNSGELDLSLHALLYNDRPSMLILRR